MALADAVASVTAQYPLGEASGGAIDAIGSLDMTEVNTVGTGTVFGGAARDFEESENDKFTHSDNIAFDGGDIFFMVSAQVVMESKTQAYGNIFGKASAIGVTEYHLNFRTSEDRFEFFWNGSTVRATGFGAISTGVPYLIHAGHDPTANEIWIAVNGVRTATAHATGGTASTHGVAIGDLGEYHDGDSGWDGLIREVIIMKGYDFDQDHIDEHYNSGSPIDFADWAGGGGFVAFPRPRGLEAGMYSMSGGLA